MTDNMAVTAYFTPVTYTLSVTPSPSGGGSIIKSPNKTTYDHGDVVTLTATPSSSNYVFDHWGGALSGSANPQDLTMTDNMAVTAYFTPPSTHIITATAGFGGNISPSGNVSVDHNTNQTFTIEPITNYSILDVVVDGESQGLITSYTFPNVIGDHTISASFQIIPDGDTFAKAISILSDVTVSGDTGTGYQNDYGTGDNMYTDVLFIEGGPDIVYTFTTTGVGNVTASLSETVVDFDLFLLNGTSASDNCVKAATSDNGKETIIYENAPVGTYYLVIDGQEGCSGTFKLAVTYPDECFISGTVVPLNAVVELYIEGVKIKETTATDGTYKLDVPDPSGQYQVRAYQFNSETTGYYPRSEVITLTGASAVVDLILSSVDPLTFFSLNTCEFGGEVIHNGSPSLIGDVVTAFDVRGNHSGTFIVQTPGDYGSMMVSGADTENPELGPKEGEEVQFKINGQAAQADPPENAIFNKDGDKEVNLSDESQIWILSLHRTWNCVTIGVQPSDPKIAAVFDGYLDKIRKIRVYTSEGIKTCDPSKEERRWTLKEIQVGYGYQIYANEELDIPVPGISIAPDTKIPLHRTWNIMPYYRTEELDAEDFLSSIFTNVKKARAYYSDGIKTCDPLKAKARRTLKTLKQGYAFQVYLNVSDELEPSVVGSTP